MSSTAASTSTTPEYTVTVSSLSPSTTKETLEHFFSFCGKISSIELEGGEAKVHFLKESAAKTAQMLNGGVLDHSTISVTSNDTPAPKLANIQPNSPSTTATTSPSGADHHSDEIEQEDKPKTAIVAELLGNGYHLSDQVIHKAIETDSQYGISARFLPWFNALTSKVQQTAQPHVERATQKVKEVDEKQGLSLKARASWIIGSKYYTAALNSPVGSKVQAFYTTAAKTAHDVHEEALRIAEAKKSEKVTGTASSETAPITSSGTVGDAGKGKDVDRPLETTTA
ncbi:uncharacterized protein JCM6883_007185 [Sporobolomyces salmoneus]|uniref:uncharacterized protein n=1 Tax=Sporobolomyces salmoneus TaxID=183962 RepID=UPI0031711A1C